MEKRGYVFEFSGLGINVQEYAREQVLFGCFFPRLPYIRDQHTENFYITVLWCVLGSVAVPNQ